MATKSLAGKRSSATETLRAVDAPRAAVPLRWVNTPLQDWSRRTLERLLDATEEIIAEKGVDAVTIPAVARAARSSVGSFYARFSDKTALLRTLHARACDQSLATAEAALDPSRWQGISSVEIVGLFVQFAVKLFRERRPMMLAFSSALGSDPVFAQRRAQTAAGIGRLLRGLLLQKTTSIRHPDPETAVGVSLRMVTATLEQRNALESTGASDVAIADEVIAQELTRAVLSYLEIREEGGGSKRSP